MFYHQKVAKVRVFADIQNFALCARHFLCRCIVLLHVCACVCDPPSLKQLHNICLFTVLLHCMCMRVMPNHFNKSMAFAMRGRHKTSKIYTATNSKPLAMYSPAHLSSIAIKGTKAATWQTNGSCSPRGI